MTAPPDPSTPEGAAWHAGYAEGVKVTTDAIARRLNERATKAKATLDATKAFWRDMRSAAEYAELEPVIRKAAAEVDARYQPQDPRA